MATDMVTDLPHSARGGLIAIALVSALGAVANKLGLLRLSFARLLGTAVLPDSGRARALGWALQLLNGALLALGYRVLFRAAGLEAGAASGAAIGFAHFLASMLTIAVLPRLHPRPKQAGLRPLGPLAYGPMTLPGMLMGHLIYGAIVGWSVRRHERERRK